MDKNIIFYKYDSISFKVGDLTKKHTIYIYDAIGNDNIETGTFLYKYEHIPLLYESDYKTLLSIFKNSSQLKGLYKTINIIYNATYAECVKWYLNKSRPKDTFNFDEEIEDLKLLKSKSKECPIIQHLIRDNIEETGVLEWLKKSVNQCVINNIINIEECLYQINPTKIKKTYSSNGKEVIQIINNIVYKRILNLLTTERNKIIKSQNLDSFLELKNQVSTKDCFNILLNNRLIDKNTNPKDIEYIFTKGASRINWTGTKKELAKFIYYLFNDCKVDNNIAACKKIKDKFELTSKIFYIDNIPVIPKSIKEGNRQLKNSDKKTAILSAVKSLRDLRKEKIIKY